MEIPYTVTARPDTGLWNAKIGIWLFLASEVMLFGGLFSAYIFLRVGADYPWPVGELDVTLGCINTFVLIGSSVTVLLAWASLKMREFQKFRIYMSITILCALAFMGIKSMEYSKKFSHYAIELKDGSIVEGHHLADGVSIEGVSSVTLRPMTADFHSLEKLVHDEGILFQLGGEEISLGNEHFFKAQAKIVGEGAITLTSPAAANLRISPKKIAERGDGFVVLKDGTRIEGKHVSDSISIEPDQIDLQKLAKNPGSAQIFNYLPKEVQEQFAHHYKEEKAEFENYKPGVDLITDAIAMKKTHIMDLAHGDAGAEEGGDDAHGVDHHEGISIPREAVHYYSNFAPRKNTYYSIYFTLTGLHGLHVIGGAIVLTYFLLTGEKMYRKDPEHLANRVEVGGLFWHFVDLVWIVLFPLLYLL